jgi:streptogramin lyase
MNRRHPLRGRAAPWRAVIMVFWIAALAVFVLLHAQMATSASSLTNSSVQAITVTRRLVAQQRVTIQIMGCTDCAVKSPGVGVWDESINAPAAPAVSNRTENGFTLTIPPGYYDVHVRSASCGGDRFLAVLPGYDRRFDLRVRCGIQNNHGRKIAYVRLVDAARGLAGRIPQYATAASMWPADGKESPIAATLDRGAYYFDEVNCSDCVLQFSLPNGRESRLAFKLNDTLNFSLVRYDVPKAALLDGVSVRGSPFNAPETLIEGPARSIWILDRLGNRVALIAAHESPREIDLPSPFADAGDIVATSHFVWVAERRFDRIVRFAPDGSHKEYQVDLAAGGFHGNLKMASAGVDRIWFIDGREVGTLDEQLANPRYFVPSPVFFINALAIGDDGRAWVSGAASSYGLGRPFLATVTMDDRWQRFPLADDAREIKPTRSGLWVTTGNYDDYLAFVSWQGREAVVKPPLQAMWPALYAVDGSDNIWFSDRYGNVIGQASPDGSVRLEYTDFGPPGISDMRFDPEGNLWVAEPKAKVIDKYGKSVYLPPRGVSPKNLLFDSSGNLWYSDPEADVVGVIAKTGHSICYAFRLSHVRNCASGHADVVTLLLRTDTQLSIRRLRWPKEDGIETKTTGEH